MHSSFIPVRGSPRDRYPAIGMHLIEQVVIMGGESWSRGALENRLSGCYKSVGKWSSYRAGMTAANWWYKAPDTAGFMAREQSIK
jgi:hypothetical protein